MLGKVFRLSPDSGVVISYRFFCKFLFGLMMTAGLVPARGQSVTDIHWYFGAGDRSIRFTRPLLEPETIALPELGRGGGAVATDPIKGDVLFYTDGISIYNRENQPLNARRPDGSNTRNQTAAICHDPRDSEGNDRFLIFMIDSAGLIRYSVYDKSAVFDPSLSFPVPPDGNLAVANLTDGLPTTPLSEGMVIVPHAARDGFWLITHHRGTVDYNITRIDSDSITTLPPVSLPGTPLSVSNLAFHPQSSRLGVSPAGAGQPPVLLHFDQMTGDLTDTLSIDLSPLGAQGIYDMAWAPSGEALYVSGNFGNANDELVRVNLLNTSQTERVRTQNIRKSYGLQYGPDGYLYHLYESAVDGHSLIGRLEDPDNADITQVLYTPTAIVDENTGVPYGFEARQFPSFLPEYNLIDTTAIDFTYSGACANVPVFFFPQVSPYIGEITWNFGDTLGISDIMSPVYTYSSDSTYLVTMTVTANGVSRSVTKAVTVEAFDLTIAIDPTQQYWCPDDFPVTFTATGQGEAADAVQFQWSNQTAAEANAQTGIEAPGTYYVVGTDPATGCAAYMEQEVIEYGSTNNYANVWYFGNNAGIDFNPLFDENDPDFGTIQPIPPGDMAFRGGNLIDNGPEGYAIYCDQGGRPLVYSNGASVYNKSNTLVTDQLGGSPGATQSAYIVQNGDDATTYYIFFTRELINDAGYDFGYAVFDLKLNGGEGDLVRDPGGDIITTTLLSCSSERITGNADRVIVHDWGNNNFRAYPIAATGIGNPAVSNVGRSHSLTASGVTGQGYMKLNGSRLGVALSKSLTENYIELFEFDNATGAVTENMVININAPGQVYGIEFSGENLYATLRNSDGGTKVLWWDFVNNASTPADPLEEEQVNASVIIIADEPATDMGALQTGPNGTIYIAKDGAANLAAISSPGTEPSGDADGGTEVGYTLSTPPDLGAVSRLGLPNFVDFNGSSTPSAGFEVSGGCQNDSVFITISNPLDDPDREIESYVVNISGPDSMLVFSVSLDEDNTEAVFTQADVAGLYTAEFFVADGCSNSTTREDVITFTVHALPSAAIETVGAPSACGEGDGFAVVDFDATGTVTYSLAGPVALPPTVAAGSTTGLTIPNLSAGQYTLTMVSNATGCDNTVTFGISDPTDYSVVLEESSAADCNDENGLLAFSFSGPPDYDWQISRAETGELIDSGNQDKTPDVTTGAGDYTISIRDSDGCTSVDNATITSPSLIEVMTAPGPFAGCDGQPVEIAVFTNGTNRPELYQIVGTTVSEDTAANYSIVGAGDSLRLIVTDPNLVGEPGIYNYALTVPGEEAGPCTNTTTFTVSFGNSTPSPYLTRTTICPDEVIFERTFTSFETLPDGFRSVEWFTADGRSVTQIPGDTLSTVDGYTFSEDGSSINVFVPRPLTAVLTNIEGCVTEAVIDIVEDCEARITAPSAFSPNGDNRNDAFRIFPFLIAEDDFRVFIFNRWGEMVFQSGSLRQMTVGEGWNGGYDNDPSRPLPGGTYAYKVSFKNSARPEEDRQEQRGSIMVIR